MIHVCHSRVPSISSSSTVEVILEVLTSALSGAENKKEQDLLQLKNYHTNTEAAATSDAHSPLPRGRRG